MLDSACDIDLNPDQFAERYKVSVLPTLKTSVEAAHRKFLNDHIGRFISYRAVKDPTGAKFSKTKVLVYAKLNDASEQEGRFLVDMLDYTRGLTPFGYVVDEDVDIECQVT